MNRGNGGRQFSYKKLNTTKKDKRRSPKNRLNNENFIIQIDQTLITDWLSQPQKKSKMKNIIT